MGCFQPRDASAHTSYLIVLLKSGPRFLPGRPTIIQGKSDRSTGLEAFFSFQKGPVQGKRAAHYTDRFAGVNGFHKLFAGLSGVGGFLSKAWIKKRQMKTSAAY